MTYDNASSPARETAAGSDSPHQPDRHGHRRSVLHTSCSPAWWAPVLILTPSIDTYARGQVWAYEWLRAADTIAFSVIFTAPLMAGISAWEARRLHACRHIITRAPRGIRALASVPLLVTATYAVGLLLAVAITSPLVLNRTEGLLPHPADSLELITALTIGVLMSFLGTLFGWLVPRLLTPVITLLGAFAAIMASYIAGSGLGLVSAGGATASLAGLRISTGPWAWRTGGCLVLVALAGSALARAARKPLTPRACTAWVLAMLAVVGVASSSLSTFEGNRFSPDPSGKTTCTAIDTGNATLQACLYPGYTSQASTLRQQLGPVLTDLATVEVPIPDTISQDPRADGPRTLYLSGDDLLRSDDGRLLLALSSWYVPRTCTLTSSQTLDAYLVVAAWIGTRGETQEQPVVDGITPATLHTPTTTRRLQEAISVLAQCEE